MSFALHPASAAVLASAAPAAGRAYGAVLDSIVSGATGPGSLLSEGAVAAGIGMSRTPVREAFLRLNREGLLDLYPKRGAIVTAPSPDEERELLQARSMFEVSAVGWLAAAGAVPEELGAELGGHLDRQAAATDPLAFARSDRAMHEAIVAAGGNSIAAALFEQTGPRLMRYWHRAAGSAVTRERLAAEHRQLVDVVLEADPDAYAEYLRRHLEGVERAR
jgi:DNA-binding GntR family transcriptional regulator